ncbi:hypothetical protein DMI62_04045 [Escherichia coli]|nr:hypothetical protein [Escherichia coli]
MWRSQFTRGIFLIQLYWILLDDHPTLQQYADGVFGRTIMNNVIFDWYLSRQNSFNVHCQDATGRVLNCQNQVLEIIRIPY